MARQFSAMFWSLFNTATDFQVAFAQVYHDLHKLLEVRLGDSASVSMILRQLHRQVYVHIYQHLRCLFEVLLKQAHVSKPSASYAGFQKLSAQVPPKPAKPNPKCKVKHKFMGW